MDGRGDGQWLQTVLAKLHRPAEIKTVTTDKSYRAKLRSYQQDGPQWLHYLHTLQFGACVADDMEGRPTEVILSSWRGPVRALKGYPFASSRRMECAFLPKRNGPSSEEKGPF